MYMNKILVIMVFLVSNYMNRLQEESKSACHHTTRAGGADQEGHPDRVKTKGAAGIEK